MRLLSLIAVLASATPARGIAPPAPVTADHYVVQVGWSCRSSGFYGLGQLSLYRSDAREFVGALQLAPLTRVDELRGLAQIGAYNESVFFFGAAQVGLVNMNRRQFVGLLQLAVANVHLKPAHTDFAGALQVGVLNLHQGELFGGAQIGVLNGNYGRSEAILALGQLGAVNYSTELTAPLQLALLGNVVGRLNGAQIAPLGINWAGRPPAGRAQPRGRDPRRAARPDGQRGAERQRRADRALQQRRAVARRSDRAGQLVRGRWAALLGAAQRWLVISHPVADCLQAPTFDYISSEPTIAVVSTA